MAIPNEKLKELVQEIESQALSAQRDIHVVKTTISAKQRDVRMLELTSNELSSLPGETRVYEGMGKMFISRSSTEIEKRLGSESTELRVDISNLNKKLHYLETTYKNSQEHIEKILKSNGS